MSLRALRSLFAVAILSTTAGAMAGPETALREFAGGGSPR